MIVSYKNNRLVPALIVTACICFVYYLIDPSVDYGSAIPALQNPQATSSRTARPAPTFASWSSAPPVTAVETPTPKHDHETGSDSHHDVTPDHSNSTHLSPSDVLLVMKTGSTSMWKRLLVHLTTSLSPDRIPQSNTVIYSDQAGKIGSFNIIDVLANITEATKKRPDFDIYRQQPEYDAYNVYVEAAGVDGDNFGPAGGWIIDKYKFVPLMAHAGENWPKAKWYVYMEDDTYLFLPNVLAYLSNFDWRKPHYLGSFAGKSDVVFAHGGAGFAISRGAWEKSFGQNPNLSDEYEQYTADHCCGDQVLGHALKKFGVEFGENDGDGKFTWGFNPIVHWRFAFSKWNWCTPLLSFHKVHNRDVARYYDLERTWASDPAKKNSPMLHRDFFLEMIAPDLRKRIEWWDNLSELYQVSSGNKASPPVPETKHDIELWKKAWESTDACEAACKGWANCVQWSYVEDLCKMDDKLIMGQGYAPAMSERKTALKRTSGWLNDRLESWACS